MTQALADYGYLAIFVLMLLESACIPIPSEVTMLFGGALTTAAFAGAGNELTLAGVVLAGTLGNLIGSWLAYWAGDYGGRPMIDRLGRYLLIRPHEVDRAHAWFQKRGEVDGVRLPAAPRGPDVHLAAGGGGRDAVLAIHPLHAAGMPALVPGAGLDRGGAWAIGGRWPRSTSVSSPG